MATWGTPAPSICAGADLAKRDADERLLSRMRASWSASVALLMACECTAFNFAVSHSLQQHDTRQHSCRVGRCVLSAEDEAGSADAPAQPEVPCYTDDWRVQRARLEEANSKRVRARKPKFLPISAASAVAQQLGLQTKEEWEEWLELGEGRTPYVPSDPESVYSRQGSWIGWRAFLTGEAF